MFRHPCKPLTKVEHWGMTFSERFCKNFPRLACSAAQESVSEQSIDDSIKTFLPVCLYLHFCIGNSSVWIYVCLCLCRRLYKVFFHLYAKFNFYCFCTWTSDIATDVYEWFKLSCYTNSPSAFESIVCDIICLRSMMVHTEEEFFLFWQMLPK